MFERLRFIPVLLLCLFSFTRSLNACEYLFVTNSVDDTAVALKIPSNVESFTIQAIGTTTNIAIHPNATKGYIANYFNNTVTVFNTRNGNNITTISAGSAPYDIAIMPNGSKAYVTNNTGNDSTNETDVVVIDTVNDVFSTTITIAGTNTPILLGIAITPNGQKAYVADPINERVVVIDTATNTVDSSIAMPGLGPFDLAITPDGATVYVTDIFNNQVHTIDTATHNVDALPNTPIAVGNSPEVIAIAPDGTYAYVSNFGEGSVTVIDLSDNTPNTLSGFERPHGIAINGMSTTAYIANIDTGSLIPITVPDTVGTSIPVTNGVNFLAIASVSTLPATNFTGTATCSSSTEYLLTLQWTASESAAVTRYDIYEDGILKGSVLATDPLTFQLVTSSIDTPSDFTIRAVVDDGCQSSSVALASITNNCVFPATNFTGTATCFSSMQYLLTLQWTASASAGVTRYDIYENAILLGSVASTDPLEFQTITTDLTNPSRYTVVAFVDNTSESAPVALASITINCVFSPSNFTASAVCLSANNYELTFNWTASTTPGVVAYRIYQNAALLGTVLATNPLTFQTQVSSIANPTEFTIIAVNGSNVESDPVILSSITLVTPCQTGPAAPTNFIGTVIRNSFLNKVDVVLAMRWTASVSPVVSYKIFRKGSLITTILATQPLLFVQIITAPVQLEDITIVAVDADGNESNAVPLTIV